MTIVDIKTVKELKALLDKYEDNAEVKVGGTHEEGGWGWIIVNNGNNSEHKWENEDTFYFKG